MRAWNGERERVGGWGRMERQGGGNKRESSWGSSSDLIRSFPPLRALSALGSFMVVGLLTISQSAPLNITPAGSSMAAFNSHSPDPTRLT